MGTSDMVSFFDNARFWTSLVCLGLLACSESATEDPTWCPVCEAPLPPSEGLERVDDDSWRLVLPPYTQDCARIQAVLSFVRNEWHPVLVVEASIHICNLCNSPIYSFVGLSTDWTGMAFLGPGGELLAPGCSAPIWGFYPPWHPKTQSRLSTRVGAHCSKQLSGQNAASDLFRTSEIAVHFLRWYYPRFWTTYEQAENAVDAPDGQLCALCFKSYMVIDEIFQKDTPYVDYALELPAELGEILYFEVCDNPNIPIP